MARDDGSWAALALWWDIATLQKMPPFFKESNADVADKLNVLNDCWAWRRGCFNRTGTEEEPKVVCKCRLKLGPAGAWWAEIPVFPQVLLMAGFVLPRGKLLLLLLLFVETRKTFQDLTFKTAWGNFTFWSSFICFCPYVNLNLYSLSYWQSAMSFWALIYLSLFPCYLLVPFSVKWTSSCLHHSSGFDPLADPSMLLASACSWCLEWILL